MPAVAAHHQFGTLVQQGLPADIQAFLAPHQAYFTLGWQGPDLLFYHKPLTKNPIADLGNRLHGQSGYRFFSQVLSQELTPQQLAYVLGVGCHYGLDRSAHPFINTATHHQSTPHRWLESAFDHYIEHHYGLDANRLPCFPTKLDTAPLAQVYGIPPAAARKAFSTFRLVTRLLDWGYHGHLVERLGKHNNSVTALCLSHNPGYAPQCETCFACFTSAIPTTITLVTQLYQAFGEHTCPPCNENFEGCILGDTVVQ